MALTGLITAYPKMSIIVLSLLVTLFTTLVTYFVTDRELMRSIKEKQKWIKEEMKKCKDNADKMIELNKQMMEHFPAQMKQTFKIMLVTFIPLLVLLWWIRGTFTEILPNWIWWYIGSSLVFSIALRKIFKLD